METPPTTVEEAENDNYISELHGSIHLDSNVRDALYVHTVIEEVKLEINDPMSATEATLFSLNNIEEKEPQHHAQCCMAKPSSSSCLIGTVLQRLTAILINSLEPYIPTH